jgi:Plasminogen-binding protein pgbA N-terminal
MEAFMSKIFLTLCLFAGLAFSATSVKIEKLTDNGYGAVVKNASLKVGQSGVVRSWISDDKRAITAKAIVIEAVGSEARIRFDVFGDIAQDSLPRYLSMPKVGDEVVFDMLESRVLIITKNQADYLKAVTVIGKQVVHPDLFAFMLSKKRKGEPKPEQFDAFCSEFAVGNVYFAISDKLYKTDCGTLGVLESASFASQKDGSFEGPFFHRLGKTDTGFLGMGKESVDDYEAYYMKLLGLR